MAPESSAHGGTPESVSQSPVLRSGAAECRDSHSDWDRACPGKSEQRRPPRVRAKFADRKRAMREQLSRNSQPPLHFGEDRGIGRVASKIMIKLAGAVVVAGSCGEQPEAFGQRTQPPPSI